MPSVNGIKPNGVKENGATLNGTIATNYHVVLTGRHQVVLEDRPVPQCKPGHVLVKVMITGICGSDYSFYSKGGIGNLTVQKPLVLGHESCGVVYEVGEGVATLSVGDRVAIEPAFPCRVCRDCRTGHPNYCRDLAYMATPPTDGTLCQWYLCPITNLVKIPPSISWAEAACIQPLAVAIHATSRARVSAHENIVVLGSGALGLLCMAVAKALGARIVVAVDISRSRLEFAQGYAATHAHLARQRDPEVTAERFAKEEAAIIAQQTGVDGFDVVIEASGAEQSMHMGFELLRPGGTFLQAGLGSSTNTLPFLQVATKELNVYGTLRYTAGCFEDGIDFIERGLVDLRPLVTRVYPLDQSEEAFTAVKEGVEIKIAIMNQEVDE